ncbi:MAG TPA: OmpH family outer membrane protein [Candidatus Acidoferrales bacterium]|nr:OmpH family outer membrane protein [Candidatus Acidoferrales bacterium]
MRSTNRRASLALTAVILATAALCGCSRVDVHSDRVRGVAYVRVDDVIKHHPLYPQLQQIDDAIAAINFAASLPHAPLTPAQIAAQTKDLNAQLQAAQDKANQIIASKQQSYAQQEHDAEVAAVKAAGVDPSAAGLGQVMNVTSQAQAQQAAQAAQQGYMAYQQGVIEQDNAALQSIQSQLNKAASDKLRARAEEYSQNESDLSLKLAQQDASQRMSLRTQLNTLALTTEQRKSVTDQLAALDKKEADQVNGLRAADASALAAYRKQLMTQTAEQMRRQQAQIQSQTGAKLAERRDQVSSQLRGLGSAPVPTVSLPPDLKQRLAQIHEQYAAKFQADAQQAVEEYQQTKADLDAQFAALHGQGDSATGAAAKQLYALQNRESALTKQIQDQIQREAVRLAKQMGFTLVLDNVQAANGGYDMTNDLIHDLESQHE